MIEERKTKNLLFAHAFSGCDTNAADHFYKDDQSECSIGNASIEFFEILHSATEKLADIRKSMTIW